MSKKEKLPQDSIDFSIATTCLLTQRYSVLDSKSVKGRTVKIAACVCVGEVLAENPNLISISGIKIESV